MGDEIDLTVSVEVKRDNRGTVTLYFTSLYGMVESGNWGRVYAGVSFPPPYDSLFPVLIRIQVHYVFSCIEAEKAGEAVARSTLENFDAHWREF